MSSATKGFIYLAVNESMPGLVKIGRSMNHPEYRMLDLASTGVPTPFMCAYLALIESHETAEAKLHQLFSKQRINKNREFFKVPAADVIAMIRSTFDVLYEEADEPHLTEQKDDSKDAPTSHPQQQHSRRSVEAIINRRSREALDEINTLTAKAKKRFE